MNTRRIALCTLAVLILAIAACGAVDAAEGAAETIEKEIGRLDRELTRLESADVRPELRDQLKLFRDRLAELRALKTPEARLYRLRDPFTGIESLAMMTERKADAASIEAVSALWNEQKSYVLEPPAASPPTLLQRALVEAANNRAEKLFNASLPYAKVTEPAAGLYYISDAVANRKFADFAVTVAFPKEESKALSAALLRETTGTLETDAIKVFESDPGGRTAITPSARLKETRELLDRGFLAGATLLVLETRMELSRRGATATYGAAGPVSDSIRTAWSSFGAEQRDPEAGKLVTSQVLPLYDSLRKDH